MFKPQSQIMHEQMCGGSVMPVQLPEPPYPRITPLPQADDPTNFGPVAAQSTFGSADEQQQHADAVLETASIKTLLGRALSRLVRLQGLELVAKAEQRLAPLREALGAAFGLAAVEDEIMQEFTDAVEEQHEEVLSAGKRQSTKLSKLREELVGCDVAFENAKEATAAAQREYEMRRSEPLERWAGKKERAARQKELDGVQKQIDGLRALTTQAVAAFNAKQEECEAAQAELVEIDRAEKQLRSILDGNSYFVDPEYGLSRSTGGGPPMTIR